MPTPFSFGKNWLKFASRNVPAVAAATARRSLERRFGSLDGKSFMDIGSGSGLFSLGAHQLGAERVVSLDVDPHSVRCTEEVRARWADAPPSWRVFEGSVLDEAFMASLEPVDVVYAWGSLHHTGSMWEAIRIAASRVAPGGSFFLAIYNRHPTESELWVKKKRRYNQSGPAGRLWMKARHTAGHLLTETMLGNNPIQAVIGYDDDNRGMSYFRDLEDWLGGEPYEFATVEEITEYCEFLGFERTWLNPLEGTACNEFLFERRPDPHHRRLPALEVGPFPSDPAERRAWAVLASTLGHELPQGVELTDPCLRVLWGQELPPAEGPADLESLAGVVEAALRGGAEAERALAAAGAGFSPAHAYLGPPEGTEQARAWGDFVRRSVFTARGLPIPGTRALVERILARPAPHDPPALLASTFGLARGLRQGSHRAREARDRLRELVDATLEALAASEDAAARAQLVTALAEASVVLPGWLARERPLASCLERVPWPLP